MDNLFHIKQTISDLFLDEQKPDSLQRNDEWYENRRGRFTGSKISELMGTSNKAEWGRPEKILDFNDKAKKYVFGKAKERQRKRVLKRSIGKNGEFGEHAESIVLELLKKLYPDYKFEETGFIEFIKGIAGASPDGLVNYIMALEIKLATIWETQYLRHEIPFDQKNADFWQIQSEMLALNVDKCMYVVAEPPEDLYEMDITDLSIKIVDASPIHQKSLIHRCMIGNKAIELYLSGVDFQKAIEQSCTNYMEILDNE